MLRALLTTLSLLITSIHKRVTLRRDKDCVAGAVTREDLCELEVGDASQDVRARQVRRWSAVGVSFGSATAWA